MSAPRLRNAQARRGGRLGETPRLVCFRQSLEHVLRVALDSAQQRLGRSGRRGEPAILRGYVIEPSVDERTPLPDALRAQLFQSVAMTELLLEGWCEPPEPAALHLSTLTQQLLSL